MAPLFRYSPGIVEVLSRFPQVAGTQAHELMAEVQEMLYRRDTQLEDFLAHYGTGKEYATVVIAAADSHLAGKRTADFVCDGVDDQEQFALAAASLPEIDGMKQGRIECLEGNYECSAGLALGAASAEVGLTGQGSDNTTITISEPSPFVASIDQVLHIADITIISTGGGISNAGGALLIENAVIDLQGSAGFVVAQDLVARNVQITNAATGAATLAASRDLDVSGCAVTHNGVGVQAAQGSATTKSWRISGTHIKSGASSTHDILLGSAGLGGEDPLVVGNSFSGATTVIHMLLLDTQKAVVASNTFSPAALDVDFWGTSDSLIGGNNHGATAGTENILLRDDSNRNAVTGNRCSSGVVSIPNANCFNNNVIPALNPGFSLLDGGTSTVKTIAAASLPPTPPAHASTHESGSTDPITGLLDANARLGFRRNSTGSVFLRRRINLIEGSNITISLSDDSGSEEVDVTITSTASGGVTPDVQTFVANGTWTKPSGGQTRCRVILIGGGGGGGSGRRGAASSARGGGGGGGGGGYTELDIPLSALSATQAVVAGAAGTAGGGIAADSTNGNAGTAGASSTFAGYSAGGGGAGAGGTTSAGAAGTTGSGLHAAGAGGGGGGIDASDVVSNGSAGSTSSWGLAGGAGGS